MIVRFAFALALGALNFAPALAQSPTPAAVALSLAPENGFKLPGTVTWAATSATPAGLLVTVIIAGVFIPEDSYPAAIYAGSCEKFVPATRVALKPLLSGKSVTALDGPPLKSLLATPHVVAVASAHHPETTISCGAIRPQS
jgi:hypothetical protein